MSYICKEEEKKTGRKSFDIISIRMQLFIPFGEFNFWKQFYYIENSIINHLVSIFQPAKARMEKEIKQKKLIQLQFLLS